MLTDTRLRLAGRGQSNYRAGSSTGAGSVQTIGQDRLPGQGQSIKGKTMSRTSDSRLRNEGFRKAEASLRLEGMDPSGTPLYESIKARIISGKLTYEQGRSEILAYYTKADTDGPATVGEMLVEEFLKPLNMSHDELAEAMGICKQYIDDIICGLRRLTDDEARVLAVIFGTDEGFLKQSADVARS